jgi:heterodisulfide reductase subunit C
MAEEAIKIGGKKKTTFIDQVKGLLPEGGNLNLCLTCGACSSGCPATGLEGMDPRKFLRMAALGLDEEVTKHPGSGCAPCASAASMSAR